MSNWTLADQIGAEAAAKTEAEMAKAGPRGFHVPPQHEPPQMSAFILQGMMVIFALIMAGATYVNYVAVQLIEGAVAGNYATQEEYFEAAAPIQRWGEMMGPVTIGIFALSAIAYLAFVYFASRNLVRAHAAGFTRSPWGAVGVSFLPFANLVMIYQVMRDIWASSNDPRRGAINASALLAPWWILYLIGNFGSRILDSMMTGALATENIDAAKNYVWMAMALCIAIAVSCILLFMIVGGIVRAQATWREQPAPPSPDAQLEAAPPDARPDSHG